MQRTTEPRTGRRAVLLTQDGGDRRAATLLADLAEAFVEAEHIALPQTLPLTQPASGPGETVVALGYGSGASAIAGLLDRPHTRPGHAVLMHPRAGIQRRFDSELAGLEVLVTAGAADADMPAETVGALIDALDAAGASTRVFWHRGGSEITDEEVAAIRGFVDAVRAALADIGALPVRHIDEGAKGRYVIEAPGNAIAEMSYSRVNASLIIVDHTQVPEVFRGTGTGRRLLEALIADARETGTKVIPVCPFAAAQFDKHPQWADIVSAKVRVNARPGG